MGLFPEPLLTMHDAKPVGPSDSLYGFFHLAAILASIETIGAFVLWSVFFFLISEMASLLDMSNLCNVPIEDLRVASEALKRGIDYL